MPWAYEEKVPTKVKWGKSKNEEKVSQKNVKNDTSSVCETWIEQNKAGPETFFRCKKVPRAYENLNPGLRKQE